MPGQRPVALERGHLAARREHALDQRFTELGGSCAPATERAREVDAALKRAAVLAHRARLAERGEHVQVTHGVSVHRAHRRRHAGDGRAPFRGIGQRLVYAALVGLLSDPREDAGGAVGDHRRALVSGSGHHAGDPRRHRVRQVLA